MEAQKFVWQGAIPLQIHLHNSEVTTVPPPPPAFVLAPRIGYLPLLIPLIKPYFATALPPGVDTVWFDYKGLPLKWYIPTGVLYDLLCAEPERPWNLTIHFRGYPNNLLIPCEGEDSVKWSFINSLKEADYIVNGNCKNVMNMSQSDQVELWRSVMNGNMEAYARASSKLRLGTIEDEFVEEKDRSSQKPRKDSGEADIAGQIKTGKIPVRLYVWSVTEDFEELEDIPTVDNWDKISYVNHPVEVHREEGKWFTLYDALKVLLPEVLGYNKSVEGGEEDEKESSEEVNSSSRKEGGGKGFSSGLAEIILVRIHGIEPKLEIPFSWVVNNLKNPEHFIHICVVLKSRDINSFDL